MLINQSDSDIPLNIHFYEIDFSENLVSSIKVQNNHILAGILQSIHVWKEIAETFNCWPLENRGGFSDAT